jgi:hypothetical protein
VSGIWREAVWTYKLWANLQVSWLPSEVWMALTVAKLCQ